MLWRDKAILNCANPVALNNNRDVFTNLFVGGINHPAGMNDEGPRLAQSSAAYNGDQKEYDEAVPGRC